MNESSESVDMVHIYHIPLEESYGKYPTTGKSCRDSFQPQTSLESGAPKVSTRDKHPKSCQACLRFSMDERLSGK